MKRTSFILASFLAVSAVMSGCGSSAKSTSAPASSAAATAEAAKEPLVELKYAFPANKGVPKEIQDVSNEVSKLTQAKINAKISAVAINDAQYIQQITLMISGGEQIDVMTERGGYLTTDVSKNQLKAMDTLLPKYGAEVTKALGNYIRAGQINGKQYAVPAIRNMANAWGIVMRKDIVDKYKIDTAKLKTLDDVEAMFRDLQPREPGLVLTMSQAASTSMYMYMFPTDNLGDGFGVLMNSGLDNTKVVELTQNAEYAKNVKYIRNWFQKGYILKDNAVNTQAGPSLIKAGKAFSYFANLKPGFDAQASNSCGTPMVSSVLSPAFSSTEGVASYGMAIPVTSKYPERAMQFINLMYSDPQIINLFDWGIEGKHYVKMKDSKTQIEYPEGVTAENTGYGLNMGFQFGNQLLSYVWKGDSADLYTQLDTFNKGASLSKAFGFMFDASAVKTEYAALTNVKNQYKIALEDGALDPDEVMPKYAAAMKDAGIEKYIQEKQKQLDNWQKTQTK